MPDFDTRKPQESDEPNRSRMTLIANGLRGLLAASKLRILLMAGTLRRLLMANRRRTLVIGGGIVLFMVAAPLGLSIVQKDNDQHRKTEDASLTPLAGCPVGGDRNPSKVMEIVHKVWSSKKIIFVRSSHMDDHELITLLPSEFMVQSDMAMYMISTDGTSLTRLSKATATKYGADRLPDGRRMVIDWSADGRKVTSIRDRIRSETLGLVGLCSPDGKKAIFADAASTSSVSPSSGPESDDLYVQTDNGTKKVKDAGTNSNDTNESGPAFSPDSEKLAFLRDENLYVANADGTDQTKITNDSGGGYYLAWWPDSEKIAFVRGSDIYVINADGTGLTQLTSNAPAPVGDLVISPDGKKIAYLGQFTCGPEDEGRVIMNLYVINADGSGLTNLTHDATCSYVTVANVQVFLFSPDSKQIAFELSRAVPRQPVTYDLYVVNVDGTDLTRLTNTEDWEGIITWVWK